MAENVPPEDPIDYGTGEGAAYGGTDTDAPIFIPHPHESRPAADQGDKDHDGDSKYQKNIVQRGWATVVNLCKTIFASSAAWSAIASVVMAIATVFYTVYAHRQWVAMSEQIVQMRRTNDLTYLALQGSDKTLSETLIKMQLQADAMNRVADKAGLQVDKLDASVGQASRLAKATEEANRNAVAADRPWMGSVVTIDKFAAGEKPSFTFIFVNSGRRPARVEFTGYRFGPYVKFPADPDKEFRAQAGDPEGPSTNIVVPGQNVNAPSTAETPVEQNMMNLIDAGTLQYFAFAKVEYRDLRTNELHWTHMCVRYIPKRKVGSDTGFRNCTEYNEAN